MIKSKYFIMHFIRLVFVPSCSELVNWERKAEVGIGRHCRYVMPFALEEYSGIYIKNGLVKFDYLY